AMKHGDIVEHHLALDIHDRAGLLHHAPRKLAMRAPGEYEEEHQIDPHPPLSRRRLQHDVRDRTSLKLGTNMSEFCENRIGNVTVISIFDSIDTVALARIMLKKR